MLERRWGRPIFASEAALLASYCFLCLTAEKTLRMKEKREAWQPGQEWTVNPDPDIFDLMSKPLNERTQLVVLKFRDVLRRAWIGDSCSLNIVELLAQMNAKITATENGRIELVIDDTLGAASILFLREFAAGRLGMCANPQCPSPYFVRSRRTQKFCDVPACMVYSHRVSANNYWSRNREKELAKSKKRIKSR